MSAAKVAVAIVSFETRGLLGRCLRALEPDHGSGLASVWVVDNASRDGSADLVRDEFPWVQLIAAERNLGFGAAVNLVAEQSGEPWLAPSNADVRVRPGALRALLATGEADGRAGVVAPRLLSPRGGTQQSVHAFPTPALALAVNSGVLWLAPKLGERLCFEPHWRPERPRYVDWAHGAFLLCRRAAFDQVGGFNPDQWLYAEDLDLGWRMRASGWMTRYEPEAEVEHELSAATVKAFGEATFDRHVAAAYSWMLARRGRTRTWAYAILNLLGNAGRWLALGVPAVLAPERHERARSRAARAVRAHGRGLRPAGDLRDTMRTPGERGES